MTRLGTLARKIRSKNAGPFWITVDIFCAEHYSEICRRLTITDISRIVQIDTGKIRRFDIEMLQVIKISFPRHSPQGSLRDRDMHGAQIAVLFAELEI